MNAKERNIVKMAVQTLRDKVKLWDSLPDDLASEAEEAYYNSPEYLKYLYWQEKVDEAGLWEQFDEMAKYIFLARRNN